MSNGAPAHFDKAQSKPLIVGHRGFRGKFPENTMLALREGVKAGATIVETDIQLASDDVVVICHDVDTKRVFNEKHLVEKTPYHGILDKLVTKGQYKEKMPLFEEVADAILNDAGFKGVTLMLDIKMSNGPHVVPHVAKVLKKLAPYSVWKDRIILGVWRFDVFEAVQKNIPELDVVFIGWQLPLAEKLLAYDQVKAISLGYACYTTTAGEKIMEKAIKANKDVYAWTMNSPENFKWAVAARLTGIITDYPDILKSFLDTIDDKVLMSEYFTSTPNQFYPILTLLYIWFMNVLINTYFGLGDRFPKVFKR